MYFPQFATQHQHTFRIVSANSNRLRLTLAMLGILLLCCITLQVNAAVSSLSAQPSAHSLFTNGILEVSGKLTRLPDAGVDLRTLPIALSVTAPGGNSEIFNTQTSTDKGEFGFLAVDTNAIDGFTAPGEYTLTVSFAGNSDMDPVSAAPILINVTDKAGYALIVQGRLNNNNPDPGLASHNKTTNRIYNTLINRGFLADDILYYNYDTTQTFVDDTPSKSAVQNALESQLPAMTAVTPAPISIFMIDHGSPDLFHIGTESISPAELDTWMTTMETALSTEMAALNRVLVYGACYSGSFIPTLSKPGRLLITSAAADEESYMGPIEADGIRAGEFFIEEFIKQLQRGDTFKGAFTIATGLTESYTRRSDTLASSNRYFDSAAQHPLLDDNGDGLGSNLLDDISLDGEQAASLYLGVGLNFLSTEIPGLADIKEVSDTQFVEPTDTSLTLFVEPFSSSDVGAAWFEVRRPNQVLTAEGGSIQLQINLDRVEMLPNPDPNIDLLEGTYNGFTEPGLYEIFYYVSDVDNGDISATKRSLVYKKQGGNQPPSTVTLLSPPDSTPQKTVMAFDWSDASDPEGGPVTYTLEIASAVTFDPASIEYRVEQLSASASVVDERALLPDGVPLYWRVSATDRQGQTSTTAPFSLNTDNTNGVPGIIQGLVYSNTDFARLNGANVTASTTGTAVAITELNGEFILLTAPGQNISIDVSSANGDFATRTIDGIAVTAGATTQVNVGVDVSSSTGGSNGGGTTAPPTSTGGGGGGSMHPLTLIGALFLVLLSVSGRSLKQRV